MNVTFCEEDGVGVVMPHGNLTAQTADTLRNEFDDWYARAESPHVVVDFADVDFMDSTGLGLLLGLLKAVTDRLGRFRLCHVGKKPMMVIDITRSYKVLDIRDSRAEAIQP